MSSIISIQINKALISNFIDLAFYNFFYTLEYKNINSSVIKYIFRENTNKNISKKFHSQNTKNNFTKSREIFAQFSSYISIYPALSQSFNRSSYTITTYLWFSLASKRKSLRWRTWNVEDDELQLNKVQFLTNSYWIKNYLQKKNSFEKIIEKLRLTK